MSDRKETLVMYNEGIRDDFHKSEEIIMLYLIDKEYENTIASVSIGHIDFRASFHFDNNEDAIKAYDALKKAVYMDID